MRTWQCVVFGVLVLFLFNCNNGTPVDPENSELSAFFNVSPAQGSVKTIFKFEASKCQGDPNSFSELKVRWDWQNDGIWDTNFSTKKTYQHKFPYEGAYEVALQVMNSQGLKSKFSKLVVVESQGNYLLNYSDDFSGLSLDMTKWIILGKNNAGRVFQSDKIYWDNSGSKSWAGHGLRTVHNFENSGKYIIEGDYQISDLDKSVGAAGTGIVITGIYSSQEANSYRYPIRSIIISFTGEIFYSGTSFSRKEDLTIKNVISAQPKSSGVAQDIFYHLSSEKVHLKIELDTDKKTIKCWANYQDETFCEGALSNEIWNEILNGYNHFKIEEFRSWNSNDHAQHNLDNWSIRHVH